MTSGQQLDDDFVAAAIAIFARAARGTLEAGVPIFYHDEERNIYVMERPDGVAAGREVIGKTRDFISEHQSFVLETTFPATSV